jgi:hypothetical protein
MLQDGERHPQGWTVAEGGGRRYVAIPRISGSNHPGAEIVGGLVLAHEQRWRPPFSIIPRHPNGDWVFQRGY